MRAKALNQLAQEAAIIELLKMSFKLTLKRRNYMDAYKHGFVVKSQKELEELMGPPDSDGWGNQEDEFSDSFPSDMMEYIGRPSFETPSLITDGGGRGSKVRGAWGWNFDTRWVHELKRCTLEELIKLSIPLDKVYAVCVPSDIEERISMRGGLNVKTVNLVPSDVAVALKSITVPGNHFVYVRGEVDIIEFLGHVWMPDELEVLYIEQN